MLIKHPSLLVKLQKAITKYKRELSILPLCFCKLLFWQFFSHPVLSAQSVTFPCVSPEAMCTTCCQKWHIRNESVLHHPFCVPLFFPSQTIRGFHLSLSLEKLKLSRYLHPFSCSNSAMMFNEASCDWCYGSVLSELTCHGHLTFLMLSTCNIICPIVTACIML